MKRALILLIAFIMPMAFTSCSLSRSVIFKEGDISPYSLGLASARNGLERYQVLVKTHKAAIKAGVNVDYSGIDTIRLEIPVKPSRIPLTKYNDFKGCVFVIKNTNNDTYLFDRKIEGVPIVVDKRLIDSGNFRSIDSLKRGRCLLIIQDENLWVANRKGHSYGHTRKDILLIENGVAKNSVIMPYNNDYSKPKCTFIRLDNDPLILKNLTIERDPRCTFLTNITLIIGNDDVRIMNVDLHTPANKLVDDRGFFIRNCTNVMMDNVRINGTYSQLDHSGYGVSLDNVWNFNVTRLYGKANWGIFGNNNVNTARIENSTINRFDIHCYGRDISFKNVNFIDLYNGYSSVYGTITYDNCTFTDFVPVLNGGSYNANVAHEVVFNNCVFNASPKKRYLIRMANLNEAPNSRHELSEKCLPNVKIKNLTVNMTGGESNFYILYGKLESKNASSIGGLSNITIDGLTINSDDGTPVKGVSLCNIEIQTKVPVECQINNVTVNQTIKGISIKSPQSEFATLKANLPLKGGTITMKNVKNLKQ